METYSAIAVANTILALEEAAGRRVDPLRLQKLLYLCEGHSLAANGRSLFSDSIQAWPYGPVVESVYHVAKGFGRRSIDRLLHDRRKEPQHVRPDDVQALQTIQAVLGAYRTHSGVQLLALTHRKDIPEGRPWFETWEEGRGNAEIPRDLMRESFSDLIREEVG